MKSICLSLLVCAVLLTLVAFSAAQTATNPTLSYSTYLSGSNSTRIAGSIVDANGYQYVTGATCASDFPTTAGAYRRTPSTSSTAGCPMESGTFPYTMFIAKLNRTGRNLVYSTFIGSARPLGIAVDSAGNAYAIAQAEGTDVPTTPGAWRQTCSTSFLSCYVLVKLNPTGSALAYSTYLRASDCQEEFTGVAVDKGQQAHAVGFAGPQCYTTSNAFKRTMLSGKNTLVMKFNSSGSGLVYSTYLGGYTYDAGDYGQAIAMDSNGRAIIAGYTSSSDFPTSGSAFQRTRRGTADAFVAKLSTDGSALLASTLLGGSNGAAAYAVTADRFNTVYVAGRTSSTDFPITPNAPEPAPDTGICGPSNDPGPCGDNFITKFPADFSHPVYSTYLGGPNGEESEFIDVSVDNVGHAYVTGVSSSTAVPLVKPTSTTGLMWLSELSTGGDKFLFSTRYGNGPNGSTVPHGIGVDLAGNAYAGGDVCCSTSALQTTPNAYQTSNRSATGFAAFAAKWDIPPCTLSSTNRTVTICAPRANSVVPSHLLVSAGATDNTNVSSMKAYVDGTSKFSIAASHFNTYVDLAPGTHRITVKARDSVGSFSNTIYVTVQ